MKCKLAFSILFLPVFSTVLAQYSPKADGSAGSLLLTEKRIDRPLLVHKNQIQVNAGYDFLVKLGTFDYAGSKIDYQAQGLASSTNQLKFNVRYGIMEFLEFSTSISYLATLERNKDLLILGNKLLQATSITESKGMSDLELGLGIRPFTGKSPFDLAMNIGICLPTASGTDPQPAHVVTSDSQYVSLDYRYFTKHGNGMPFLLFGLDMKYRLPHAAFILSASGTHGVGETSSVQWHSQLSENEFIYTKSHQPLKHANRYTGLVMADAQIFSWFDLYAGFKQTISNGGWKEINNLRYALPDEYLSSVILGVEILTTVHLRILEHAELVLAGKNSNSFTGIFTTFSYNLISHK